LPEWLTLAVQEMQEKYPDDRFEVISRKLNPLSPAEWRIKCLDCPGKVGSCFVFDLWHVFFADMFRKWKLYTPGPAETLSNYEVHIKNRQHRQRVNNRVHSANNAGEGTS